MQTLKDFHLLENTQFFNNSIEKQEKQERKFNVFVWKMIQLISRVCDC